MQLNSASVEPGLKKKGFSVEQGKDIIFRHYYKGKRSGPWTKISHGARHDIHDSLVSEMKKQLKLQTAKQVRDLCECPMSEADYVKILQAQGYLPQDEPPKSKSKT
jgi:hypothetical protein